MDPARQERSSQRLPEIEALFEAVAVIDKITGNIFGEQAHKIGRDQSVHLQRVDQYKSQPDADRLLSKNKGHFKVRFIGA